MADVVNSDLFICNKKIDKKTAPRPSITCDRGILCHDVVTREAFRNEILATCQPASLAKRPKCRNDSYF